MSDAVIVSCHGTVSRLEDLPEFLRNIRRGHDAPPELVAEVRRRFEHIGGSPLMQITARQAAALEARLNLKVRVAGRLWAPYPAEVVAELASHGVRRIVSLPLAPQSVDVYHAALVPACAEHALDLVRVPPWGTEPALIEAFATALEGAAAARHVPRRELGVVLSAHSLPLRVLASGDPYEQQFRAMAELVAKELVARGFSGSLVRVAFQSQGFGSDAWLGPTLEDMLVELRRDTAHVLIGAIGFLAEHVETLYDLDVEARALAERLGYATFLRMPALDDAPRFIDALELVARRALASC